MRIETKYVLEVSDVAILYAQMYCLMELHLFVIIMHPFLLLPHNVPIGVIHVSPVLAGYLQLLIYT